MSSPRFPARLRVSTSFFLLLASVWPALAAPSPLTVVKLGNKFYAGVPTQQGSFQPWFEPLYLGFEMRDRIQYHHFGGDGIDLLQRFLVVNPEELAAFPGFHFRVDRAEVDGKPVSREQVRAGISASKLPTLPASALASPELGIRDQVLVYSPDIETPEGIAEMPVCVAPPPESRQDWKGLECFWTHEGLMVESFRTRMIPHPRDARELLRLVEPSLRKNFLEKRSLWNGQLEPRHFLKIEVTQVPSENENERDAVYRLKIGEREFGALGRYFFGRYVVYSGGDPHLGYDPVAVSLSSLDEKERALLGWTE